MEPLQTVGLYMCASTMPCEPGFIPCLFMPHILSYFLDASLFELGPVPNKFLGIVSQDPSDSKSNRLHVDIF